jgi:hypothetical protein
MTLSTVVEKDNGKASVVSVVDSCNMQPLKDRIEIIIISIDITSHPERETFLIALFITSSKIVLLIHIGFLARLYTSVCVAHYWPGRNMHLLSGVGGGLEKA